MPTRAPTRPPTRTRLHSRSLTLRHLELDTLEAGLDHIRESPSDRGRIELIVRRPAEDERELLEHAELDIELGLVGDRWSVRHGDELDPRTQLTLMNARAAALVAGDPDRRPLAGDQLFVDLDLGEGNIPAGTRLQVGAALVEISEVPHRGCGKFSARFGVDAVKFVNSAVGRELNLRGVNARVIAGGAVRVGDLIEKLG